MSNIWIISDTHFNHKNILGFTDSEGKKFRGDLFKDVSDMNEQMIYNWNSVIKPEDKVYHLGDVYFGSQPEADAILSRLMGKKRLIVGNHDCIYGKGNILQKHFQRIYMWRLFKEHNMCLTHVPILPSSFRKVDYNVHGHIHQQPNPSEQHINVSVERIGYAPVHIEDVIKAYGK